jgi:hypothetical protein
MEVFLLGAFCLVVVIFFCLAVAIFLTAYRRAKKLPPATTTPEEKIRGKKK